ncbi:MAG: MepB family protein [Canibacter sp.]
MTFPALERYRQLLGLGLLEVVPEEQSSDYESGMVALDSGIWRIRTARITPTKPGAFVAVWRRSSSGTTEPFDSADDCEGLMVFVSEAGRFGVFAFTREHLTTLGIVQSSLTQGKRGFRVYPSWSTNLNAQAVRTQRAQANAFTDLTEQKVPSALPEWPAQGEDCQAQT